MRKLGFLFVIAFSALRAGAAPLTFQEVQFLVRQHVPEGEIIAEVKSRRVLNVPAPEVVEGLRAQGASADLIAVLQLPDVKLSAEEAAAYQELQKSKAAQAAAQTASENPGLKTTGVVEPREASGKNAAKRGGLSLFYARDTFGVPLEPGTVPVAPADIKNVRMFILFSNVSDNARSAAFTRRMVALYPTWKERYCDFEVVAVDSRSPGAVGFLEFVAANTTWPTAFLADFEPALHKCFPRREPRLVPVSAAGVPFPIKVMGTLQGDLSEVERLLELEHRR
jgi:hypothetical protein